MSFRFFCYLAAGPICCVAGSSFKMSGSNTVDKIYILTHALCFYLCFSCNILNPLHPNISMHILHTILYIFPLVQTGRICLTIKSFFSW